MGKLKEALVRSYVGAISVGTMFATGITYLVNSVFAPLAGWITRYQYRHLMNDTDIKTTFSLLDSVSPLATSISILFIGYLLLRWLYFKPLNPEVAATPESLEGQ